MNLRLLLVFIGLFWGSVPIVFAQPAPVVEHLGKMLVFRSFQVKQDLEWFSNGKISITTSLLSTDGYPYLTTKVDDFENISKGSKVNINDFKIFIPDFLLDHAGNVKMYFYIDNLGKGVLL
ncbi:MAG: hypothetical protein R3A45_12580 [Bdellovibrionota bacterium]